VSRTGKRYESAIEFFNDVYRRYERYWWARPTRYSTDPADHRESFITAALLEALEGRRPGRALDLGAGEGTDAIRLALLGYEVDAVEGSWVGAEKTEVFARQVGIQINVIEAELSDFKPQGLYDVIVCNGVLHYMPDKDALVQTMQDATAIDGFNAVSLWSDHTPVPECHRVVHTYPEPEHGSVVAAYKDWLEVAWQTEHSKPESGHPGLDAHSHSFVKFLTQKRA
jgi:SAM-dependent methyltransferase